MDTEQAEGKFNAGLSTLQRINDLFIQSKNLAIAGIEGMLISRGKAQHLRCEVAYQLYLASCSLIDSEEIKKRLKARVIKLKPLYKQEYDKVGVPLKPIEMFDHQLEIDLREAFEDITISLQKTGKFFMPSKEDEGL